MKLLDILILIPIAFGAINGFKKGLVMEVVGILAFVVAAVLGFKFLDLGMEILAPYITWDLARKILPFLGFAIIFFPTVYIIAQIGTMLKKSLKLTFLGTFDSLAGMAVGIFTWVFGVSVLFWLLFTIGVKMPARRTEGTVIYPMILPIAPNVVERVVEWIPVGSKMIKNWKGQYLDQETKP